MKKCLFTFWAMACWSVFFFAGCEKNNLRYRVDVLDASSLNLPKPELQPAANAGIDQFVVLPLDSVILQGYSYYFGNSSQSPQSGVQYEWKKITGPETFAFENSHVLRPNVIKLGKGNYEFELTATDSMGLSTRDSAKLFVMEPTGKEIILHNLEFQCPMGCGISVLINVPTQNSFTVFVGNETLDRWVEVLAMDKYTPSNLVYYELRGNSLTLYSDRYDGRCDLKIVF